MYVATAKPATPEIRYFEPTNFSVAAVQPGAGTALVSYLLPHHLFNTNTECPPEHR